MLPFVFAKVVSSTGTLPSETFGHLKTTPNYLQDEMNKQQIKSEYSIVIDAHETV